MDLSRDFNYEYDIEEDESIIKHFEKQSTAAIMSTKFDDTTTSGSPQYLVRFKNIEEESFDRDGPH